MFPRGTPRDEAPFGEDERVAVRAVVIFTAAVGLEKAVVDAAGGNVPIVAIPAMAAVATLAVPDRALPLRLGGWAAAAIWLVLVPGAPAAGVVVALAMVGASVAIGVGPARAAAWVARDVLPDPDDEGRGPRTEAGWIEDDPREVARLGGVWIRPEC